MRTHTAAWTCTILASSPVGCRSNSKTSSCVWEQAQRPLQSPVRSRVCIDKQFISRLGGAGVSAGCHISSTVSQVSSRPLARLSEVSSRVHNLGCHLDPLLRPQRSSSLVSGQSRSESRKPRRVCAGGAARSLVRHAMTLVIVKCRHEPHEASGASAGGLR